MNAVLTTLDLRAPIGALIAIGLMGLGVRLYLNWSTRADTRRAEAVERALQASGERPSPEIGRDAERS